MRRVLPSSSRSGNPLCSGDGGTVLARNAGRLGSERRGGSKRVVDLCDARLRRLVAALEGVEDEHGGVAKVNGMGKLENARAARLAVTMTLSESLKLA
jgi:hypothetical protein